MVRHLRRLGLNVALLLMSLAVSLCAAEVAMRILRPQPLQALHWWPDGTLRHRPSFRYTYTRAEFSNTIAWNSHGMRGPEIPLLKTPGVPRVVVLGDSFVEGQQVGDDEVLTAVMEEIAREEGRPLEVVNMGVSGIGTAMEIHLWESLGRPLEPDIVLLGFYPNDVANNAEREDFAIEQGRVVLRFAPRPARWPARARAWLAARSHLFIAGLIALDTVVEPRRPTAAIESQDTFAKEPTADVRWGWEMTLALLDDLAARVEEAGARFVLVVIPARFQVDHRLWQEATLGKGMDPEDYDPHLAERTLEEWALRRGVTHVGLLDPFRARNVDNSFYYAVDSHWNAEGHRLAARSILDAVSSRDAEPPAARAAEGSSVN